MERMAQLGCRFRPIATLMGELREEEDSIEAPWRSAGRNDACPCGSARKYTRCCLGFHRPR
ncbi:MAG: YecA family protein [Acidimicrobiales bacterium]